MLPSEEDIASYQEHGFYKSKKLLPIVCVPKIKAVIICQTFRVSYVIFSFYLNSEFVKLRFGKQLFWKIKSVNNYIKYEKISFQI